MRGGEEGVREGEEGVREGEEGVRENYEEVKVMGGNGGRRGEERGGRKV